MEFQVRGRRMNNTVISSILALLAVLALLLTFAGWPPTLEEWKTAFEMAAIVLAGIWTYSTFVRERHGHPMTTSEHEITDLRLNRNRTLLRVCVTLRNDGRVLVPLQRAVIYVRQIRPFPTELEQAMEEAWNKGTREEVSRQIREGQLEGMFFPTTTEGTIQWGELGYRQLKWEKGSGELEPGEKEQFCADFILFSRPDTVEVVTAVENVKEKGLHWVRKTIYNLEADDGREGSGRNGAEGQTRREEGNAD